MFANFERAGLTERLEKMIEEDVCLAFLVAGDVLGSPRGKGGELFGAGITHEVKPPRRGGV